MATLLCCVALWSLVPATYAVGTWFYLNFIKHERHTLLDVIVNW